MPTYTQAPTFGIVLALRTTSNVQVAARPGDLHTVIGSGFSQKYPFWCSQVPNNVVLLSNGIDPLQRWDSATGVLEAAGVPAPTDPVGGTILDGTASDNAAGALIYALCRFYDNYGNVSDLSPIGEGVGGYTTITSFRYDHVPLPTGPYASKVVGRQLLRNVPGEAQVFYVDIDTADLTGTTFTSHQSDDPTVGTLQAQTAVPILDGSGNILANTHGFPPSHKAVTAPYLGRVFATAEVTYGDGHVVVASYSDKVQGVGTSWPLNFAGRHLFISNPPGEYAIKSVDVVDQIITLTSVYNGPSDNFAIYGIRAAASEWRLIYYSPSNEPESWPPTYALSLQDDGDEITGLMQLGSFLYILEHKHIYRLTFLTDPAVDGAIFLSSRRGCLSQRLWVQAEATAYMFDELGVHAFSGGNSQPISDPIQDLWRDNSDSPLIINWNADTSLWSCSCNSQHTTVRFFVALTGSRYPRHALCYNYRNNRWWIEEYRRPVCSTGEMVIGTKSQTVAGLDANSLVALDVSYVDGSRGIVPTLTGTVTARSPCSLTDGAAKFTDEVVNMDVGLTMGRGKGQQRRIVAVTNDGTRLATETPWKIAPAVGDRYRIGAIKWQWKIGWFRLLDDATAQNARDVEVLYQPLDHGTCDVQLYYNRGRDPKTWSRDRGGLATIHAGDPRAEIDLTNPNARGIVRIEGHRDRNLGGELYVSPELDGFQHGTPIKIYRITLGGCSSEGGQGP
jgi:hypothetical protein